jgi:hypothetical protein
MTIRLVGIIVAAVVFACFQNCSGGGGSSSSPAPGGSQQAAGSPSTAPTSTPSSTPNPTPVGTPTTSGSPVAANLSEAQLQGTWSQACIGFTLGSESLYTMQSISFTNSSYTLVGKLYTSSGCASSGYVGLVSASGPFTLGADATEPATATDLNLSFTTATLTPESSIAVSLLNFEKVCGISNWAVNVPKTLSAGCIPSVAAGAELFTVAQITSGNLFLGEIPSGGGNNGTSAASRIDTLGATPYTP